MKIKNDKNETLKAGCVVVNDKQEVLLVTDVNRKTWTFPKGHVEEDETVEQVALREVLEETGYKVKILNRLSDVTYMHGKTGELIRVAMFRAIPIELTAEPEKEIHSKWCPISEARKVIYYNLAFLLDEINNSENYIP